MFALNETDNMGKSARLKYQNLEKLMEQTIILSKYHFKYLPK
jgi:hypothetical protein